MERPSLAITIQRIAIAMAMSSVFVEFMKVAVSKMRPDATWDQPQDVGTNFRESYDFIVVGSGSAGSVIASRLSEVEEWNVLLLEAGGPEPILAGVPFFYLTLQRGSAVWERYAEPDPNYCLAMEGNRCYLHSGKSLGGTSAINAMLYVRGNRRDYDNWAALGNTGWDYETVLRYFKKSEDMRLERLKNDTVHHSTGGYLTVDEFKVRSPIADIFLQAGQEMGYDIVDHNGFTQRGFTRMMNTVRDGYRCSAAKAFLGPAKDRKNLDVSIYSEVERILIDPNTSHAYGVVFRKHGTEYTVLANKEVVISAGALESPKLLMLSGIGPADHLQEMNISPIIADLQVGHNLQDHILMGGLLYLINQPIGVTLPRVVTLPNVMNFLKDGQGPLMATGLAETCAFVNSNYSDDPEYPDLGIYLTGGPENVDGGVYIKTLESLSNEFYNAVYEPVLYKDAFISLAALMRPKSRGVVRLKGKDPKLFAAVYPNYLSDEHDVKVLVEGAKFGLLLSNTKTMQQYGATPNPNPFPGCTHLPYLSDEYFECAVRQHTMTLWHYSGTCKMGPEWDGESVVDPRLRVRGVTGLRVADASIMPVVPTANLNAPTIMIGEKASDMIKEDWGSPTD